MRRSRLTALAGLRCPRCREGRVFRGILDMHAACPRCGLVFEPEPGYFTGAMVVSYGVAVVVSGAFALSLWGLLRWPVEIALIVAVAPFLALVPVIFRYSRVI